MDFEEMSSESQRVCSRADTTIKMARAWIDDVHDANASTRTYLKEIKERSANAIPIDWESFKI